MIKLYVGCDLTHASDNFKQKVTELKSRFRKIPEIQVLEFLGTTKGTPRDVFVHDIIDCVCACDVMVAICDEPSIGLGWEMATQVTRGRPLLAFGHLDSKITRLVLDPDVSNYQFYRYEDFDDIYEIVMEMLED